VRKIDLWSDCLRSARRRAARVARSTRSMLKMRTNLLGFVFLDRTRVSFAFAKTEFREYVKNLATLDFHFAR
jgi:hypothetical protein